MADETKPIESKGVRKDPEKRPEFNPGEKITLEMETFLLELDNSVKQYLLYLIHLSTNKANVNLDDDLKLTKQFRNAQNTRYNYINKIVESETKEYADLEKIVLSTSKIPSEPNIGKIFNLVRNPLYQVISYTNSYDYEVKHNRYFAYKYFDVLFSNSDITLLERWNQVIRAYTNDPDYVINLVPKIQDINAPAWPYTQAITGSNLAILRTIRTRESGGNYSAKNPKATASGAYQFMDGTWNSIASEAWNDSKANEAIIAGFKAAGMDIPADLNQFLNNYHRSAPGKARFYPPAVQDAVADYYISSILRKNNNDVSKVPLVWFTGNAAGKISAAAQALNDITPQQYQEKWMAAYDINIKKQV